MVPTNERRPWAVPKHKHLCVLLQMLWLCTCSALLVPGIDRAAFLGKQQQLQVPCSSFLSVTVVATSLCGAAGDGSGGDSALNLAEGSAEAWTRAVATTAVAIRNALAAFRAGGGLSKLLATVVRPNK